MPCLHPPAEPDARWYRLALLMTGDAAAAEEIVRSVFAVASNELPHLRSRHSQVVWMVRQIRVRALKCRPQPTDAASLPGRVALLPEPNRSIFALFHCIEGSLEEMAIILGLSRAAFAGGLARARQELAPGIIFSTDGLLRLHRPWGGDQPKVAKVVCAARDDAKLAAQIAVDRQWHRAIGLLDVPEELSLLHLAEHPKARGGGILFQPAVLAIALALAVVVGVLIYYTKNRMDDFAGKDAIVALVEAEGARLKPEFEHISPTAAGKLGDWFVLKGYEGFAAPGQLQKAKVIGCRILKQDGIPMAEVVFEKQNARMLVFRAAEMKSGIESPGLHIFQQEEWAVAAWNEQENSYVLMLNGDWNDMPGFLQTAGAEFQQ